VSKGRCPRCGKLICICGKGPLPAPEARPPAPRPPAERCPVCGATRIATTGRTRTETFWAGAVEKEYSYTEYRCAECKCAFEVELYTKGFGPPELHWPSAGRTPPARLATADGCLAAGSELKDRGSNDAALAALGRAIELDPSLVRAFQARAQLRESINDLVGALVDYRRVLEIDPADAEARSKVSKLEAKRR
jgi:tetratricopeptide (TPR) repeat protein